MDTNHESISIKRQCSLLGISRSGLYYAAVGESDDDIRMKNWIDQQYLKTPYYGSRRMAEAYSRETRTEANRKRFQRLMREMGIEAIYPKPSTSLRAPGHKIYPYLLRGMVITKPNQVWSTDITYVRLANGFAFLVAVIDWYSRYVLSWSLSNTMDTGFCVGALNSALELGSPLIFNTDQGSQFTSAEFTGSLLGKGIAISMDGRGRALDNIFVERLWRSVKYEDIYPRGYAEIQEAESGLAKYFWFYNHERPHQSLDYATPAEVHSMAH